MKGGNEIILGGMRLEDNVNNKNDDDDDDDENGSSKDYDSDLDNNCTLVSMTTRRKCVMPVIHTELRDLVIEFQSMIHGFSGPGAATVAQPRIHEIHNVLRWQREFHDLYYSQNRTTMSMMNGGGNRNNRRSPSSASLSTTTRGLLLNSIREVAYEEERPTFASGHVQLRVENMLLSNAIEHFPSGRRKSESDISRSNGQQKNSSGLGSPSRRNLRSTIKANGKSRSESAIRLAPEHDTDDLSSADIPPPPISVDESRLAEMEYSPLETQPSENAASGNRNYEQPQYRNGDRSESEQSGDSPLRLHPGSNVYSAGDYRSKRNSMHVESQIEAQAHRSRLFRSVAALNILPLLLMNLYIYFHVSNNILSSLPSLVAISEPLFLEVEVDQLKSAAKLRAFYMEAIFTEPIRNVYFLKRVAGWLLFDAIERSDAFPDVETKFIEECKTYPEDDTCPYFQDETRSACDCDWQDNWQKECKTSFGSTGQLDTRYLQKTWFICQSGPDSDLQTGNRSTSNGYPEHYGTSAETTYWWNDTSTIPGAEKGSAASGYETIYDRLRVLSALSVVHFPLYNYVHTANNVNFRVLLATYFAAESDGMLHGYAGCNSDFAHLAHYVINEFNSTGTNRPDLCPLGKYGYDARCRPWYAAVLRRETNSVAISPPTPFSPNDVGAGSAGAAVVDPRTGVLVGQILVDFATPSLTDLLEEISAHFYFVIVPDAIDGDVVFASNYTYGGNAVAAADLVLPHDETESPNRRDFGVVMDQMRQGVYGDAQFSRTLQDGSVERLRISYAPVHGRVPSPVRADSFESGADVTNMLLFSLGVVRLEETLQKPFADTKAHGENVLYTIAWLLPFNVILISFLCVAFLFQMSLVVTRPMILLLQIVQNVNAGNLDDDIPPLSGGSREIKHVYNSFAKLFKIVRVSNKAFYSGNLDWAYHIILDALHLFQKVGDQKAIAIARNNLGNILLAMSLENSSGQCREEADGTCLASAALIQYNISIRDGTVDFDRASPDDVKAGFAQQLADRHFNRGMFYLFSAGHECLPENARDLGYADLVKTQTLDGNVRAFWLEKRLLFKNLDTYFDRLLRRIYGLAALRRVDANVVQVWDANALVEEADQMLTAAWDQRSSPLFVSISRVGRLQQLESAVMVLELNSNAKRRAGYRGIRMLVEDEFLVGQAFHASSEALLGLLRREPQTSWSQLALGHIREDLDAMLKRSKNSQKETRKYVVFCFEVSWMLRGNPLLAAVNKLCHAVHTACCNDGDSVAVVGSNRLTEQEIVLKPGRKGVNSNEQKRMIDITSQGSARDTSTAALSSAVAVLRETPNFTDSFILLVTDGSSWDVPSINEMRTHLIELNEKRGSAINLLIIGLTLNDDAIVDAFQHLGTVSSRSTFVMATLETATDAFERAAALILTRSKIAVDGVLDGITMQRF